MYDFTVSLHDKYCHFKGIFKHYDMCVMPLKLQLIVLQSFSFDNALIQVFN